MKNSAGKQFLDLLDTLDLKDSVSSSPDPIKTVFDLMEDNFRNDSESINNRINFREMQQKPGEKHASFLDRLIIASKKCGFSSSEIEKELFAVVRVRSTSELIRFEAARLDATVVSIRHAATTVDMDTEIKEMREKSNSEAAHKVSSHKRSHNDSSSSNSSGQEAREVTKKHFSRDGHQSFSRQPRYQARHKSYGTCIHCGLNNHRVQDCE